MFITRDAIHAAYIMYICCNFLCSLAIIRKFINTVIPDQQIMYNHMYRN